MKINMRLKTVALFILLIILTLTPISAGATVFTDVPAGNWAEENIAKAVELGVISGYGDQKFGFGDTVTRAQFAAMLVRLFGWPKVETFAPTFTDNGDSTKWYYSEIETAAAHGAILKGDGTFRPEENITREDMAIMLIRGLGYQTLSGNIALKTFPFLDVTENKSQIKMAYDFGIISGMTAETFSPKDFAMREQAAAMMIRLHDRYASKLKWVHGFYAIASYSQIKTVPNFNALSFGWSKLEYSEAGGPKLNTTYANNNEFAVPSGAAEVIALAQTSQVPTNLNVYMSTSQKVTLADGTVTNACKAVLLNPTNRSSAIAQIVTELQNNTAYAGVTIDFEGLKGTELKEALSLFIKELRLQTSSLQKTLYICVHPVTSDGIYYDGYDFKVLGENTDKVILMAHDYEANSLSASYMASGFTTTPLTPIYNVYTALEAISHPTTGVGDHDKIVLALSMDSAKWTLKNGAVTNGIALRPSPLSIYNRLIEPGTVMNYSERYQNPSITYEEAETGTTNVIWYEDERSIQAKIDLARMFGINQISLWRLGLIPNYGDPMERPIYYNVLDDVVLMK